MKGCGVVMRPRRNYTDPRYMGRAHLVERGLAREAASSVFVAVTSDQSAHVRHRRHVPRVRGSVLRERVGVSVADDELQGGLQLRFRRERACSAHRRREPGEQDKETEHWHVRLRARCGERRVSAGICATGRGTTWSVRPCMQSAGQVGMCAWVWTAAEMARTVRTGDASESESIEKMVLSL